MRQYQYCSVRPKEIDKPYFYIADTDIPVSSYVLVPFGYQNYLHKGIVEEVGIYTEETAPYPVRKTKHILRVITEEEYYADEDAEWTYYAENFADDIEELQEYLADEDYDAVFEWASEHHGWIRFPDIMATVVECYRLCVDHGNAAAALNLGTMYYSGTFLKRDYSQAAKLYKIAADAGEIRAICNLGYCYYYGRHQPPNYARAYYYYHLGAILHNDPNCLYKLGDMYLGGKYVKENETYAVRLYFRALEAANQPGTDDFCRPDIMMRIGELFLYGTGVERSPKRALDCLMQALSGFYERRKTDPFVAGLIERVKDKIEEAEEALDEETL